MGASGSAVCRTDMAADVAASGRAPPKVLIHGIFGWGEHSMLRGSCWPDELRRDARFIISESTGAVSSAHDRACELFYELFGGTVDYGAEHSKQYGHRRFGSKVRTAKWPNWSAGSPVDLIGHSYGGNVAIELTRKLGADFFGVGSDARWVRSIVTLSAPINGTTLVYLLGLALSDHRSVRWGSAIHLFGALAASFWAVSVHVPVLRRLYDFRQPQWSDHTSACQICMMRHPMVISEDNAFHDLAPPRRHATNPGASELAAQYLFSVTSQVNVRFALYSHPWSQRKLEVVLPVGTFNPLVLIVAALIQLHSLHVRLLTWYGWIVPPFEGADSGAWARSDGVVNTCSQGAPSRGISSSTCGAEHVVLTLPVSQPARLRRGVWHRMQLGKHHNATKDMHTMRRVVEILEGLPLTVSCDR